MTNSKFFHASAKLKIAKANISYLMDGEVTVSDPQAIGSMVINYYQSLYTSSQQSTSDRLLDGITQLVREAQKCDANTDSFCLGN